MIWIVVHPSNAWVYYDDWTPNPRMPGIKEVINMLPVPSQFYELDEDEQLDYIWDELGWEYE